MSTGVLEHDDKAFEEKGVRMLCGNVFDRLIDRQEAASAGVPDTFMPFEPYFAVTDGIDLLSSMNRMLWHDLLKKPWIWGGRVYDGHLKGMHLHDRQLNFLAIDAYRVPGKRGYLCSVQRQLLGKEAVREILALPSKPLLFSHLKAAKAIAQLCHPEPPPAAEDCLEWIPLGAYAGEL
jgi:hypothetical protein